MTKMNVLQSVLLFICVSSVVCRRKPYIQPYELNLLTLNKSASNGITTRIYGGNTAVDNQFPYMVYHLYSTANDFRQSTVSCSAGLVKSNWVLLAAHCFGEILNPDAQWSFVVGGKLDIGDYLNKRMTTPGNGIIDPDERRAAAIFVNPSYNIQSKIHDIALILLNNDFELSYKIALIPVSIERMTSRTQCTIHGWGLTANNQRSNKLMFANVNVRPIEEGCSHKTEGDFICVEKFNAGICRGDSGSPLVCNGKVWGVASHLVAYEANPKCGEDMEEYYATIYGNLEWLKKTVNDIVQKPTPEGPGAANKNLINYSLVLLILSIQLFIYYR